ncbi:ABC transporter permease [Anoxybacterium hadale]|uniref:ABC transporter permease n=2 Tax=Anoxybacterium hadale TaxID=3408580 RepID=A0ACD1AI64_9FIRM|nr:ABC transporter permease [Clostridiales bacterium]
MLQEKPQEAPVIQGQSFRDKFIRFYYNYTFLFSFAVLVIIATYFNPKFLTYGNLSLLLLQSTIKGIIACGMTLVIIAGMIDLSVGSMAALVGGLGVVVLNTTENIWIMFLFCVAFGTFLGTINGLLVTKARIAPFIVTLATMVAFRSIIVQLGQGGPFDVKAEVYDDFRLIAAGYLFRGGGFKGIPYMAIWFIAITLIMIFIMSKTKFGRYVYAVGSNQIAAKLTGINVDRVKTLCFVITGLLVGISSFLLASRLTSITAPNVGVNYELDAIAAVAIGGTAMAGGSGLILGTFIGAIMLQMIEGILIAAQIPVFLNGLVKGIIIIIAVVFQSRRERKH